MLTLDYEKQACYDCCKAGIPRRSQCICPPAIGLFSVFPICMMELLMLVCIYLFVSGLSVQAANLYRQNIITDNIACCAAYCGCECHRALDAFFHTMNGWHCTLDDDGVEWKCEAYKWFWLMPYKWLVVPQCSMTRGHLSFPIIGKRKWNLISLYQEKNRRCMWWNCRNLKCLGVILSQITTTIFTHQTSNVTNNLQMQLQIKIDDDINYFPLRTLYPS